MKRAATHKRAPVHLGPQRLNRASRHDVPSWHPIGITLLIITSTRMDLRQTIHGPTLQQTRLELLHQDKNVKNKKCAEGEYEQEAD